MPALVLNLDPNRDKPRYSTGAAYPIKYYGGGQPNRIPPAPPAFKFGINISGAETQGFGQNGTGFPTLPQLQYWASKNIKFFRILLNWQFIQTEVDGPLTSSYTTFVSQLLANAATAGVTLFLNIANFGGGPSGAKIGLGTPLTALPNFWLQFSRFLRADPHYSVVVGYDIMNEWSNMNPGGETSTPYSQNLILGQNRDVMNILRNDGDNTKLYLEWDHFSGAWDSVTNNISLLMDLALSDPVGKSVVSVHNYLDNDGSGTNFVWAQEIAKPGLSPPGTPTSVNIGPERMMPVTTLAQQKGVQLHIGETGWSNDTITENGNDDFSDWNQAGFNLLQFCVNNNIEITTWGAGSTFPLSYMYNPEPSNIDIPSQKDFTTAGFQSTQMIILEEFCGYTGPQPTNYRADLPFNVPAYTPSGTPLNNFKMRYNGLIT